MLPPPWIKSLTPRGSTNVPAALRLSGNKSGENPDRRECPEQGSERDKTESFYIV
jgi:hypothetical protein